ncbi:hypothetical protein ABPG75_002044 [Micractinium tetrahymenae]
MGRGDAARRRRKAQERAALLKGAQVPGVEKKAGKQHTKAVGQEMTRAMRKMLQLKAAAAGGQAAPAAPAARQPKAQAARAGAPAGGSVEQQQHKQHEEQPPAAAAAADQQQRQQQHAQPPAAPAAKPQERQQQGKQPQQGWQVAEHKRLKDRKRDFLKQKKLKKKGRAADPLLTEKEVALAAAAAASAPAFGEQAHQPLKVQLKRRHWAGDGEQVASASKRCTEIFKRQMAEAARAAAAAEAARDDGAAAAAGPQQRARAQGGGGGSTGGAKKAKAAKAKAKQAAPDEAVRQQLIDAYRQQKQQRLEASGRVPLLSATTQSLADLVAREARAAAQR